MSKIQLGDLVRHISTGALGICIATRESHFRDADPAYSAKVAFTRGDSWFDIKQLDVISGTEADALKIVAGLDCIMIVEAPKANQPEQCSSCAFYRAKASQMGLCRALPPSGTGFPIVRQGDWCGHWKSNVK